MPWALADAARVSLACGTEHNRSEATERDLLEILDAYSQFDDPFQRDHDLRSFLLRMSGQQLTWQVPEYETTARTAAIFMHTSAPGPLECLRPGWETELLGCTLPEYVGTAQLAWASAAMCQGRFDPAVYETADGPLIAQHVGRDTAVRVLDNHFVTSVEEFRVKDVAAAKRTDRLRRFTYNPLRGRPLLSGFGRGYLCPIPGLALAKAAPWGIYFTGRERYGDAFTRDLGHLFEQYIGRQLRLIPGAQVIGEITYTERRRTERKTVDWIVVLPEVVLLVEVKSAIPTEPVRLATAEASGALSLKLGKAFKQIDTTAQLIRDRHSVVSAVPVGLPILGLAVTLEPFHVANAGFDPLPATTTHITVADAAEIETLVTITDMPPGQLLLDRASDEVRSAWSLDTILMDHARDRNPILDEAWDSYPWAAGARAYASSA